MINTYVPDHDVYLAVVRYRIRKARRRSGLTQEDVAERTNLPVRTIQRFEARTGNRFNPTLLSLRAIAAALHTDVPTLVREPQPDEAELASGRDL